MTEWNPSHYLSFADERTRPARDLLAQVPLVAPTHVFDLGCGPGNSTSVVRERYPMAAITGVDNSPAMLVAARASLPDCNFTDADLATWSTPGDTDLLFSSAAFQWVPNHLGVLERLLGELRRGSVLAVQMPDNLNEPSHRLMAEVAAGGPWAAKLAAAELARAFIHRPEDYYKRLKPHCTRLEVWHTIYNHPIGGVAGIVKWFSSTGLRPYLAPLDEAERAVFLNRYEEVLAVSYPAGIDGTVLLRFPRLFLVAQV